MNIRTNAHKAPQPQKKVLFLSDLDGTWLSKNPENRGRLDREILEIRDEYRGKGIDLKFGYITARPPERVAAENLPTPDWTVTYNGAQVNEGSAGDKNAGGVFEERAPDVQWVEKNRDTGFSTGVALRDLQSLLRTDKFSNLTFKKVGEVVHNPSADANEFTAALCFDESSIALTKEEKVDKNENGVADIFEAETFAAPRQMQDLAQALNQKLEAHHVGHDVSTPYLFHGKPYVMLDIASPLANKGDAVSFLQSEEHVTPQHTIVAGDGGNDISMMTGPGGLDEGRRSIVVGGDSGLVAAASQLQNSIIQPAEVDSSLGVLSGLRRHLDAIVLE